MTNASDVGPWMRTDMETILTNSFRDFHAKGFDYLCLRYTTEKTVKVYFFDGDNSKLPEVVNPHDHRYDFHTICAAGIVANQTFVRARNPTRPHARRFQRFSYRTPLNGGDGFTWEAEELLAHVNTSHYMPDSELTPASYSSAAEEIHTIQIKVPETILILTQYEDINFRNEPTSTWTRDKEPPSLSGLYNRMTADHVRYRIAQLNHATRFKVEVTE